MCGHQSAIFFFFNDTATTEIYTLSLHDALPIFSPATVVKGSTMFPRDRVTASLTKYEIKFDSQATDEELRDRKSTRLNSSHGYISYAVFCLKKKKIKSRALGGAHAADTLAHGYT